MGYAKLGQMGANQPKWLNKSIRARIPVQWILTPEDRQRESVRRKSVRCPNVNGEMMGNDMKMMSRAAG